MFPHKCLGPIIKDINKEGRVTGPTLCVKEHCLPVRVNAITFPMHWPTNKRIQETDNWPMHGNVSVTRLFSFLIHFVWHTRLGLPNPKSWPHINECKEKKIVADASSQKLDQK